MKIKAFTLMELIVSMCVSAIVMAMGALAFEATVKQFATYKKNTEAIVEAISLQTLLSRETDNAEIIRKAADNEIILTSEKAPEVKYLFADSYVTRTKAGETDTFRVAVKKLEMSFQNSVAQINNHIIDLIYFESASANPVAFYIKKSYDAKTLIEASEESIVL